MHSSFKWKPSIIRFGNIIKKIAHTYTAYILSLNKYVIKLRKIAQNFNLLQKMVTVLWQFEKQVCQHFYIFGLRFIEFSIKDTNKNIIICPELFTNHGYLRKMSGMHFKFMVTEIDERIEFLSFHGFSEDICGCRSVPLVYLDVRNH